MASAAKIDRRVMRGHNRAVVLDLIRRSGPMARTDVARRTLLAKPTVSGIVDELIAEGLLVETGVGETTAAGGRPPTLIDFDARTEAYLGIHIGVDHTTVAVADGRAEVLARRTCASARGAPERSVEHVRRLARAALRDADMPTNHVRRAAVAVPGLVDRAGGVCTIAPNLHWRDVHLAQAIGEALSVPADAYNSTQASALAEARHGVATHARTFVWLYVGSGVGSAIVHDGRLVYGTRGFAGEIGHCRVVENGPRCHCGKRGCLEVFTSGPAIADAAGHAGVREVIDAAFDGDMAARSALRDAGHLLGLGTSYLVSILNPELVVVGGEVSRAGGFLLAPLRATLHEDVLEPEQVPVVMTGLTGDAALAGAVLLAFDGATPDGDAPRVAPRVLAAT
jgi:N-acetylglucosamine repressor